MAFSRGKLIKKQKRHHYIKRKIGIQCAAYDDLTNQQRQQPKLKRSQNCLAPNFIGSLNNKKFEHYFNKVKSYVSETAPEKLKNARESISRTALEAQENIREYITDSGVLQKTGDVLSNTKQTLIDTFENNCDSFKDTLGTSPDEIIARTAVMVKDNLVRLNRVLNKPPTKRPASEVLVPNRPPREYKSEEIVHDNKPPKKFLSKELQIPKCRNNSADFFEQGGVKLTSEAHDVAKATPQIEAIKSQSSQNSSSEPTPPTELQVLPLDPIPSPSPSGYSSDSNNANSIIKEEAHSTSSFLTEEKLRSLVHQLSDENLKTKNKLPSIMEEVSPFHNFLLNELLTTEKENSTDTTNSNIEGQNLIENDNSNNNNNNNSNRIETIDTSPAILHLSSSEQTMHPNYFNSHLRVIDLPPSNDWDAPIVYKRRGNRKKKNSNGTSSLPKDSYFPKKEKEDNLIKKTSRLVSTSLPTPSTLNEAYKKSASLPTPSTLNEAYKKSAPLPTPSTFNETYKKSANEPSISSHPKEDFASKSHTHTKDLFIPKWSDAAEGFVKSIPKVGTNPVILNNQYSLSYPIKAVISNDDSQQVDNYNNNNFNNNATTTDSYGAIDELPYEQVVKDYSANLQNETDLPPIRHLSDLFKGSSKKPPVLKVYQDTIEANIRQIPPPDATTSRGGRRALRDGGGSSIYSNGDEIDGKVLSSRNGRGEKRARKWYSCFTDPYECIYKIIKDKREKARDTALATGDMVLNQIDQEILQSQEVKKGKSKIWNWICTQGKKIRDFLNLPKLKARQANRLREEE